VWKPSLDPHPAVEGELNRETLKIKYERNDMPKGAQTQLANLIVVGTGPGGSRGEDSGKHLDEMKMKRN